MPYLAVDKDSSELIFQYRPIRGTYTEKWLSGSYTNQMVILRPQTIEKLIGRKMDWDDMPISI